MRYSGTDILAVCVSSGVLAGVITKTVAVVQIKTPAKVKELTLPRRHQL
jgi:hypothetical protein